MPQISHKTIASTLLFVAGTMMGAPAWAGEIELLLEEPIANSTYSGVANIRGWVVGSAGIDRVELYVDGELKTNIPSGGLRSDVGNAYPSYPNSANAGFSMAFNYSNLAAGQHTVSVRAVDKSGATEDRSVAFSVARFDNPFIDDPAKISLDGATVSRDGQAIVIDNLTADGKTYDVRLDWRTAIQGYAITQITPTGSPPPAGDFSGTYEYSLTLVSNTCPTQLEPNVVNTLTLKQSGTQLTGTDGYTKAPLTGTIDAQGNFTFVTTTQIDMPPCKIEQKSDGSGNLIGETIAIDTSIKTLGSCPQTIECAVGYQGTVKKK
jgi:hypothetical protein